MLMLKILLVYLIIGTSLTAGIIIMDWDYMQEKLRAFMERHHIPVNFTNVFFMNIASVIMFIVMSPVFLLDLVVRRIFDKEDWY